MNPALLFPFDCSTRKLSFMLNKGCLAPSIFGNEWLTLAIPSALTFDRCGPSARPMDVMVSGCAMSFRQALQAASMMSS